jgi:hypothetical protein
MKTSQDDYTRAATNQWLRDFADLVIIGRSYELDLGDLISAGLAKAAEELGGISEVVAGRPGSWESDLLLRLAQGHLRPNDAAMDVKPVGRPDPHA